MSKQNSSANKAQSEAVGTEELNTALIAKNENLRPREIGGQKGPEPTRFGDWEKNGRCSDF